MLMDERHGKPATPAPEGAASASTPDRPELRSFASAALLGGLNEAVIEHNGAHYRLRRTSKGKLILTK